jgi:hypothetical protein
MSDSLTTIISKAQATLLDAGTRFTTATLTAACRLALTKFNLRAPRSAGTLEDVVASQKEYVLSGTDYARLISISDVLLWDAYGDDHEPLDHDQYFEDDVAVVRLRVARNAGEFLVVRFTEAYTVNGLDSETSSTLPAFFDPILLDGVCYFALTIRDVGVAETYKLDPNAPRNYDELKVVFGAAFEEGLKTAAGRKPAVGQPDTRAWNDEWHNSNVWG